MKKDMIIYAGGGSIVDAFILAWAGRIPQIDRRSYPLWQTSRFITDTGARWAVCGRLPIAAVLSRLHVIILSNGAFWRILTTMAGGDETSAQTPEFGYLAGCTCRLGHNKIYGSFRKDCG